MHSDAAPVVSTETTMSEYRKEYREKQKEFWRPANRQRLREQFVGRVFQFARNVRHRVPDIDHYGENVP
jgi:hypothetical protein